MASFTRLTLEQMETLSEIIFGLSITFSAIQFAFNPPTHIVDILSLVVEFAISFTVLVWIMITYIRVMRNLRHDRGAPVLLNVALLLCATVEPYLLYTVWLGTFQAPAPTAAQQLSDQLAAAAWAVDVGIMLIILGLLADRARRGSEGGPGDEFAQGIRSYSHWFYGCGVALGLTGFPVFWVFLYSGSFGNATTGTISPLIHLALILWIPIFIALGYGAYHYGRAIDRALERKPMPSPATATMPRDAG
ncbi:MAG: hypothetical protein ABSA15_01730 [Thermoplasmata archaeon]|jgi:hypothetical protein